MSTKERPIFLTGHRDKYIYGYYAFLLNHHYQQKLEKLNLSNIPLAYRNNLDGKCNIQFSKEVFDFIRNKQDCFAIATDISSYFDNINHEKLKQNWCQVIGKKTLPEDHFKIYKAITDYKYIVLKSFLKKFQINLKSNDRRKSLLSLMPDNKMRFSEKLKYLSDADLIVKNKIEKDKRKKRGIPQGISLSAVLSNIYLLDFDQNLSKFANESDGFYRRYCDDIILIVPKKKVYKALNLLFKEIVTKRELIMKKSKTEIREFFVKGSGKLYCKGYKCPSLPIDLNLDHEFLKEKKDYLQYLGFTFNGQDVLIRNSSISRYYQKMARRIKKTVRMAYSGNNNYKSMKIFKKQLYSRYTHFGKRNFLTYAYHASSYRYKNSKGEWKEGHNSKKMRKQVSRHTEILKKMLGNKNLQRFEYKLKKGKNVLKKTH